MEMWMMEGWGGWGGVLGWWKQWMRWDLASHLNVPLKSNFLQLSSNFYVFAISAGTRVLLHHLRTRVELVKAGRERKSQAPTVKFGTPR